MTAAVATAVLPGMTSTPIVVLPTEQYQRVFTVLEMCDAARTLDDFKEILLESLGSVFGYRHVTCFTGPSIEEAFSDQSPSLRGSCKVSWPAYQERWHRFDVLSTAESCGALRRNGFTDLEQLTVLPDWGREYIDGHMGRWGYRSAAAMHIEFPIGGHALVGLTDPAPGLFEGSHAAALTLLARHLSAISRRMSTNVAAIADANLSDRLQEVAALVCAGRSNKEIAATLFLSLDTVKKYVSRILASTDCRSRSEFMAKYRATDEVATRSTVSRG